MNMPIIKVVNDDGRAMLSSIQNITLLFDDDNDYITDVLLNDGGNYHTIISYTGEWIDIKNLKCSSYEEFIVALDIHNCLFNVDIDETIKSYHKISNQSKMADLIKENMKLKNQLNSIKKLLKSI